MTNRFYPLSVMLLSSALLLTNCASDPTLSSIQISPKSATIESAGGSVQFTATGTYTKGQHPPKTRDITDMVTWRSSNTGVATINSSGIATAVATGSASISATMNSGMGPVMGEATLQVDTGGAPPGDRQLTSISLVPSSQTLNIANHAQFIAIGNFSAPPTTEDMSHRVTWQSSNTNVATIDSSGLATALACPTSSCPTIITALGTSENGASIVGTANLTVVSGPPSERQLTSIVLIPASQTVIGLGNTAQFIALGTFSAAPTTEDVTNQVAWQSSNANVATVNSSGLATAVACAVSSCSTTISALGTAENGASIVGTASLSIVPGPAPDRQLTSITLIPSDQTLNVGNHVQFIAIGVFSTNPATEDITGQVSWRSSVADVATIDSSGFATAVACPVKSCVTTITASRTATDGGGAMIVGVAVLTVTNP